MAINFYASATSCVAGFICAGIDPNYSCMPLCEPYSDPTGCEEGQICSWVLIEGFNVGVCE